MKDIHNTFCTKFNRDSEPKLICLYYKNSNYYIYNTTIIHIFSYVSIKFSKGFKNFLQKPDTQVNGRYLGNILPRLVF